MRFKLWNHKKQHGSQTLLLLLIVQTMLWNYKKQHGSQTALFRIRKVCFLWSHKKQHGSQTVVPFTLVLKLRFIYICTKRPPKLIGGLFSMVMVFSQSASI